MYVFYLGLIKIFIILVSLTSDSFSFIGSRNYAVLVRLGTFTPAINMVHSILARTRVSSHRGCYKPFGVNTEYVSRPVRHINYNIHVLQLL